MALSDLEAPAVGNPLRGDCAHRRVPAAVHAAPAEALGVVEATRERERVASHWSLFDLADEPPHFVTEEVERRGLTGRAHIFPGGGQMEATRGV